MSGVMTTRPSLVSEWRRHLESDVEGCRASRHGDMEREDVDRIARPFQT
jgi:hypothetical protein